ncbi:hypothetical protein N2152v2_007144 [Parachlorella kessleri]
MALKTSGFGGTNTLHEAFSGCSCDLCGKEADSETAEVVAMDCSFKACPAEACLYHQILKSHPISIRSEANKKRRQAELESLQRTTSQDREGKAAKKDKEEVKHSRKNTASPEEKGGGREGGKASVARQASVKALHVSGSGKSLTTASSSSSVSTAAATPGKSAAAAKKEQLALAARNLKNEIAARSGGAVAKPSALLASSSSSSMATPAASKAKEVKTLDEYLAERQPGGGLERAASSASMPPPAGNAWATKSRASSASSLAAEPALATENTSPPPPVDIEIFPPPPAPAAPPPQTARPPLPRSTSTASAAATVPASSVAGPPAVAAAAVAAAPAPVKPQPPRGAWAHKQPAVMSIVPPPPPPPRGADKGASPAGAAHSAGPVTSPTKGPRAALLQQPHQPAVQAEDDDRHQQHQQAAQPKLSKSQRKNLRRAEKKAAEVAGGAASAGAARAGAMSPDAAEAGVLEHSGQEAAAAARAAGSHAFSGAEQPIMPPHSPAAAAQYGLPPPSWHPGFGHEAAPTPECCSPNSGMQSAASGLMGSAAPGDMHGHPHPHHHSGLGGGLLPPLSGSSMGSPPSLPSPVHVVPFGLVGEHLERCMQLVVQHKLQKQVESLASLGFPPAAALAAVQHYGGNLEAAVTALLEQATGVGDAMHPLGFAHAGGGPLPEVDLSDELAIMQTIQYKYRLEPGLLEQKVVECSGDLEATARAIAEQCGDAGSSDGSSSSAVLGAAPEFLLGSSGSSNMFDRSPMAVRTTGLHGPTLLPSPAGAAFQPGGWLARDPWDQPGSLLGSSQPSPHHHHGMGAAMGSPSRPLPSGEWSEGGDNRGNAGAGTALGTFDAFGWGGFTEAALNAVHGGPFGRPASSSGQSLFSSTDNASLGGLTPRHHNPNATLATSGSGGMAGRYSGFGGPWGAEPSSPLAAAQLSGVRLTGHPHFSGDLGQQLSPFDRAASHPAHLGGLTSPTVGAGRDLDGGVLGGGGGGGLFGGLGDPRQLHEVPQGWGGAAPSWQAGLEYGYGGGVAPGMQPQHHHHQPGLLSPLAGGAPAQPGVEARGGQQQGGGRLFEDLTDLMSSLMCR